MEMLCEKCGTAISAAEGEYLYYQEKLFFACKPCAARLNDEIRIARKVCAEIDKRKTQAELIAKDKEAFEKFLQNIEATLKKIPDTNAGNLRSEIPVLISLVKSYIAGEYNEISYNTIVAVVATLLYVISPIDIIPDIIPVAGYMDDAMAVSFCMKMIKADLEKYMTRRSATGDP